jgi:hypothetical protein
MSDRARSTIARLAAIGVVLLGLIIAAYGVYLLVVGVTVVSVLAVPVGTPPGPASTATVQVMMGVIPMIAGGLILVGWALRRIWLAWLGAAVTSLFAGLFVFSIGGSLVPVAAVLFVLLGVLTWTRVNRASPSSTC